MDVFGLCAAEHLPTFKGVLEANAPAGCEVHLVGHLSALRLAIEKAGQGARLLSYLHHEIIPADVLRRFDLGAYNFHPATPDYPGTAPEAWACYEKAQTFGATIHEMTERVDEGPVIDVGRLPVPPGSHRLVYAEIARRMAHSLLCKMARQLTSPDRVPPASENAWGGTKRTTADYQAMVQLRPDITPDELHRRILSFGPPEVAGFSLELHGVRFVMLTSSGIKGHFDPILHDAVSGWALHMAFPTRRLEMKITVDGNRDFTVRADRYRADVLEAGHGDGYCGFTWEIPLEYRDGLPHSMEVSVAGTPLMGGPRLYSHAPSPTPPSQS
ncbi:Bifunctional polymyxin resistance protein ArnA [Fundidesulfovibrio magnetotacticus]|uniref:Bifunctional polymyxin resistance protein ArnA n=1 Tax=Fundidesulfovibrio magnetotacticus TaxID=2730080 RepID=A0A6V8LHP5_9BACT|nr:formyltransferase family protein [Fundidesulfovibrio magnetotacticus]GFK92232.1 Bifunctional polymyxin resistance protein ArnA [Fundidesulfovibrio magnetotacticus]